MRLASSPGVWELAPAPRALRPGLKCSEVFLQHWVGACSLPLGAQAPRKPLRLLTWPMAVVRRFIRGQVVLRGMPPHQVFGAFSHTPRLLARPLVH